MNRYLLLIFVVLSTTCRKAALVTDNTLLPAAATLSFNANSNSVVQKTFTHC